MIEYKAAIELALNEFGIGDCTPVDHEFWCRDIKIEFIRTFWDHLDDAMRDLVSGEVCEREQCAPWLPNYSDVMLEHWLSYVFEGSSGELLRQCLHDLMSERERSGAAEARLRYGERI